MIEAWESLSWGGQVVWTFLWITLMITILLLIARAHR